MNNVLAQRQDVDPSPSQSLVPSISSGNRVGLSHLVDPRLLFTAIALLLLTFIWGVVFTVISREQAAVERSAIASVKDAADTYEAQLVRALEEIDHTLKLVRFEMQESTPSQTLETLREEALLPHELLFTVSVTDAGGYVVATTHPDSDDNPGYNTLSRKNDELVVGLPTRVMGTGSQAMRLAFARRYLSAEGEFAGMVVVSVDPAYFVSGYEEAVLGNQGLLGLVGDDGVFRIRRSGDEHAIGTIVDYPTLISLNDDEAVTITAPSWDNVSRYSLTRTLYQFPLAIVVGLSMAERHAPVEVIERRYYERGALASALVIVVMFLLGRLSWKLQQARTRFLNEQVAHAQRIEYLAYHDSLTGLPNRACFHQLLNQSIHYSRRYHTTFALLFLDLDRFKAINDSLGHDAGDELLQEISRRLSGACRASDTVARLGGDEFVLLLPQIKDTRQVEVVAEKLLLEVARPFTLVGQEFRVTVSIGIALHPQDGEDEQTLMKQADIAMYHAKEEGKNNYKFYSEQLNTDSLERLALESSLRRALEKNEFRLYYQSKHDLPTGRISGVEALLRWDHPELGLILPKQFIPLAEENGLIVPIGRWVLYTACEQNMQWQRAGFPKLNIAVNLSARQFLDEALLDDITDALSMSDMAPELLELEITESMMLHDLDRTTRVLKALRSMGVRIAIDDFGTGYSSLSQLKELPVDTIKIDGSFINSLISNAEGRLLTETIIELGRNLSLTVVAEGVESAEQADFLKSKRCDQLQGFFFDKPVPADEFAAMFRRDAFDA